MKTLHRGARGALRHFSTTGLLLGTLLLAFSLTPSLLPRPTYAQGIVSGFSFSAGYALGFLAHWLWDYLQLPRPGPRVERGIKLTGRHHLHTHGHVVPVAGFGMAKQYP